MKLLWSKDLKLNTVHVDDVVRASWHVAVWYTEHHKEGDKVPIFNLADKQDTGKSSRLIVSCLFLTCYIIDQEAINEQLQSIFGIKTGYYGSAISSFAKVSVNLPFDVIQLMQAIVKPFLGHRRSE